MSYDCGECLEDGIIARCIEGANALGSDLNTDGGNELSTADWLAISALIVAGLILIGSIVYYVRRVQFKKRQASFDESESRPMLGNSASIGM